MFGNYGSTTSKVLGIRPHPPTFTLLTQEPRGTSGRSRRARTEVGTPSSSCTFCAGVVSTGVSRTRGATTEREVFYVRMTRRGLLLCLGEYSGRVGHGPLTDPRVHTFSFHTHDSVRPGIFPVPRVGRRGGNKEGRFGLDGTPSDVLSAPRLIETRGGSSLYVL